MLNAHRGACWCSGSARSLPFAPLARRGFNEGIFIFWAFVRLVFDPHPGHIISDTVNTLLSHQLIVTLHPITTPFQPHLPHTDAGPNSSNDGADSL